VATDVATQWKVKGTLLIACNCDYGCPCNYNALPSKGDCEGQWLWHVDEGSFGDVKLDGMTWTVTADWPRAIHEGGGKAICLYDERADEEQREAIEALVRGGHGGPWGVFINTYELVDIRPLSLDLHVDGLSSHAKFGDVMELEFDAIRNPVTGDEVHPGAVLPEGLVCKEMSFGATKTFRVDDGVKFDHSGQYAAYAPFEYSSS
jgi:hypothetical protein